MKKLEFIRYLSDDMNRTQKEVGEILDQLTSSMTDILSQGEDFTLQGIGKFIVEDKEERIGFNPNTKESIVVPAHRVVKFKISSELKDAVR